ncbi:uncharacterized protein LOC118460154 [Anopheles albimanus]|uniref:Uncharacterized protein n=1 Tax=Anopheles albimanus TaxID=7167 RepID=A0A182FJQ5_ANOAL|nr:uncharacterized protein LOC118460154 [Anopheles albimanus]
MALLKGGGGGPTGVGAEDGRGDGVRPPATVSYAFEKELINRQNRHIRLYDSFLPSLKRVPIAIKFWSKYDSTAAGRASGLPNFDRYCALVEKTIAEGPRDRYPEPITESQCYGWHHQEQPCWRYEGERDRYLHHHPKKRSPITLVGEKINADRITQRPRFTGVPFKLTS